MNRFIKEIHDQVASSSGSGPYYFVRGLCHHYAGDLPRERANYIRANGFIPGCRILRKYMKEVGEIRIRVDRHNYTRLNPEDENRIYSECPDFERS